MSSTIEDAAQAALIAFNGPDSTVCEHLVADAGKPTEEIIACPEWPGWLWFNHLVCIDCFTAAANRPTVEQVAGHPCAVCGEKLGGPAYVILVDVAPGLTVIVMTHTVCAAKAA